MTWVSRVERSDGKVNAKELSAAAHALCHTMALSHACVEDLNVSGKVSAPEPGRGVRAGGRVASWSSTPQGTA